MKRKCTHTELKKNSNILFEIYLHNGNIMFFLEIKKKEIPVFKGNN